MARSASGPGAHSPHQTIALGLFVAGGISDFMDGYIARRDKLITNFGILMDPLADKIMVCSAFIAFVGLNWIAAWMVAIIVARELAITGLRLLAASKNVDHSARRSLDSQSSGRPGLTGLPVFPFG